jgi:hypothetical protein
VIGWRDLQIELKRVGCDPGTTDGKWGAKARSALSEFVKRSRIALATEEPTLAALEAVTGQKGRICVLACGRGEVEQDGRCAARSAPEKPKQQTVTQNRAKTNTETTGEKLPRCDNGVPRAAKCRTSSGAICIRQDRAAPAELGLGLICGSF